MILKVNWNPKVVVLFATINDEVLLALVERNVKLLGLTVYEIYAAHEVEYHTL